jgi:hypothetical protein
VARRAGAGGVGGALVFERSQLNGERFGGGGVAVVVVVEGEGDNIEGRAEDRNGDDSFLVLPVGGLGVAAGEEF